MSDNKVVQFPKRFKSETVEVSESDMKITVISTLVIVFSLVVGINATIFNPIQRTSFGRGIASVNKEDASFEIKVKKSLRKMGKAELKESGIKPTKLDELTFGFLKGKYKIDTIDGKVKSIKLGESPNEILAATFMDESSSFLQRYATLFSKKSASIELVKVNYVNGTKVENFNIFDRKGKKIVNLDLVTDESSRFVELAVK